MSYAVGPDPYCYSRTTILRNIPGLRDEKALALFEAVSVSERAEEPLQSGRFSVTHFKAVHRHLFQDVYRWAGRIRTIRISKGFSTFCYPEHIQPELDKLFARLRGQQYLRGLEPDDFARLLASFLADLNAIHAFREGNGRTQMIFVVILAAKAGYAMDLGRLDPDDFLQAMIESFKGREEALARQLRSLL